MALIMVVATLYLAKGFLLPVTVACLLALLLSPAVRSLISLRIPKVLASLVMLIISFGALIGALWLMMPAIGEWVTTAPQKIEKIMHLEQDLSASVKQLKESVENTSEKMTDAMQDIVPEQQQPIVVEQRTWPTELMTLLQNTVGNSILVLILTLFLLTSGDTLVVKLIRLKKGRQRKQMIRLFQRLRTETGHYLGAVMLINLSLGLITSLILWLLDFPLPWVWVVLVTVLRLIPYFGMSLVILLLVLVSATHFDTLLLIAAVPVGFVLLSSLYGFIIDPLVHGFRLQMNPIIVFLAVIFWGWLWGPVGAILGVPLLTVLAVFAQTLGWQTIMQILTSEPRLAVKASKS
ncbi:AI-2E family transporter [Bowmanella dokdonensis]|uniref:AI-2E family transporter n=1 Tax=Bowmanella dokdonensis TaxID=751969 RepID=A0A939DQU1_9ALTE|nr:AI-2E family transporter [Bowmanella dokdonensis]MBN7826692.1 AI-2E family transporter [Bowmanella dokdonensis]